ncbi:MAG: RNA-dependent RNA polymerase [Hangzhou narnavirus 3]|nr:MAG: RNA-dependent RNA polymerase [Hangzhou narnavirus 3]
MARRTGKARPAPEGAGRRARRQARTLVNRLKKERRSERGDGVPRLATPPLPYPPRNFHKDPFPSLPSEGDGQAGRLRQSRPVIAGDWGRRVLQGAGPGGNPHPEGGVPETGAPAISSDEASGLAERAVLCAYAAAGVSSARAKASVMFAAAQKGQLKLLKQLSSEARDRWINGGDRLDAQLSFVGRALPRADRTATRSAILQHREDMTSSFTTDPGTLACAREFAGRWAAKHLARPREPLSEASWPSGSSCVERSTSKGGLLNYMLEQIQSVDLTEHPDLSPLGQRTGMLAKMTAWSLRAAEESNWTPRHRVTCLAERGLKTRVVTVGAAWAQVLGHSVRKRLLRALRSDAGAYAPLKGARDEELSELFVGGYGNTVVSTDLTRASDLLPFDLLSSMIDGLEDSGRLSFLEIKVLRALSGPQVLFYGKEEVVSSRGSLMGLPTTWVLLSLVHLFWLDDVRRFGTYRNNAIQVSMTRYSICGDDALLCTRWAAAERYKEMVRLCGGAPSLGKHFESRGWVGGEVKRRGVFLEKLLEFDCCGTKAATIRSMTRCPVLPLRGITSPNPPANLFADQLVRCTSTGIVAVLAIDSMYHDIGPSCLPAVRELVSRRFSWLERFARERLRLVPGVPLRRGGCVFSSKERTPADEKFLEFLDRHPLFSVGLALSQDLDPVWRLAESMSLEGDDTPVATGEVLDLGVVEPLAFHQEGPLLPTQVRLPEYSQVVTDRERVLQAATLAYAQLKPLLPRPHEVRRLRASDFVRARTKAIRAAEAWRRLVPEGAPLESVGPRRFAINLDPERHRAALASCQRCRELVVSHWLEHRSTEAQASGGL